MYLAFIWIAAAAYLLGSIPVGYVLVRIFRRQDIRTMGSGNIGATNVLRSEGKGLGAATFILDAVKGAAAVLLGAAIAGSVLPSVPQRNVMAVAALFAVLGHMFPLWLKFRGGKGVATGLGCWISLAPRGVLVMVLVFVTMVAVFRYISLASVTAAAIFPLATWMLDDYHHTPAMLGFMA